MNGKKVAKNFLGYKKNPAYQIMSDSLKQMNTIGKELGLSPKARSQMMELNLPTADDKKTAVQSLKEFFK